MGPIREVTLVKPVCGVTLARGAGLSEVLRQLEKVVGTVEDRTPIFDFSFTAYYREEMGSGLQKIFLSFKKLIHPGSLPDIKKQTNAIETQWSVEGKRKVNLDPGYITGAKLVLASTKDFSHRIYLADGIYGDVQLEFRHNRFHAELWTFPDYQTDMVIAFFQKVRKNYIREIKKHE